MRNQKNSSINYLDVQKNWIELAKIDYSFYCEYVYNLLWKPPIHLELVCKKLEEVEKGNIKRLMIFMPPRHGKSMTVSIGRTCKV